MIEKEKRRFRGRLFFILERFGSEYPSDVVHPEGVAGVAVECGIATCGYQQDDVRWCVGVVAPTDCFDGNYFAFFVFGFELSAGGE